MARLALATWCTLVVFNAAGESLSASERTHESVAQVIQDKVTQAALGVALFFLSFPILFFNERRQVTMYATFQRVASLTSTFVRPDQVDARLDRRLVHMQAPTSTASVLEDREFGVTVSHALALTRECEIYQWVEKEHETKKDDNFGGKTIVKTYSYTAEWSADDPHKVFREPHGAEYSNVVSRPSLSLGRYTQYASSVSFGAFKLPRGLWGKLCNGEGQEALPRSSTWRPFNGWFTDCVDPRNPRIGEYRVRFTFTPCGPATLLAVQSGSTFVPFTPETEVDPEGRVKLPLSSSFGGGIDFDDHTGPGQCSCCSCCCAVGALVESGEEVFEILAGLIGPSDILGKASETKNALHSLLQAVGTLCAIVGLYLFLSLGTACFRLVPYAGTYAEAAGNWVALVVAGGLGIVVATITIAVAWIYVRPAKALGLLLLSGAVAGAYCPYGEK